MNNKNWAFFIVIVLIIIAYYLGEKAQYNFDQQAKYQGYTVKEWYQIAKVNGIKANACEKDPNSVACNPFNKFFPTGTPTPIPTAETQYVAEPTRQQVQYTQSKDGRYLYGSDGSFCQVKSSGQILCQ